MKCVFILLSALLLTQMSYAFQGELNIPSTIQRVKVFREGAQVTRIAKVTIPVGQTVLKFTNLSSNLESESIQVKADGNFTMLSVAFEINYLQELEQADRQKKLQKTSDSLQTQLKREQLNLSVWKEEEALVLANKDVGGSLGASVEKLNAMVEYYAPRLSAIKLKILNSNDKIEQINKEITKIQNQLKAIDGQNKRKTGEVWVLILAKAVQQADFELDYVVKDAGWFPAYDVRVKDINSPLNLSYKANIHQSSGEDWKKVQLNLSSGNPNKNNVKPELKNWRVNFFHEVFINRQAADTVVIFDPETYEERIKIVQNEINIPDVNLDENPISFEFSIEIPYDIPSNGDISIVTIKDYTIPAYYEYYTAPKLDPTAFLTAQLINWEQYNLLNGEANLYFEGTYLGKSFLDVQTTEDTLTLSLGRDENVVVTRTKEKQFGENQFIGNKKTETRGWDIELRNKKKQRINIVVEDQYPLSTNDDIEVTLENAKGAEVDKENGKLKWKLAIEPNKVEKLNFRYSVKYPKKERLVLE